MLPRVKVNVGGQEISVGKVASVVGDVSVNVRKGRIRQIFDLTLELEVKGATAADLPAKITDYMSDTVYGDFEFSCAQLGGPAREAIKRALWQELEAFKEQVREMHGKTLLVQGTDAPSGDGTGSSPTPAREKFNGVFAEDKPEALGGSGSGIFEDHVSFAVPPQALWSALTEPAQIMAWTRGSAQVSRVDAGAELTLLGGNVLITVIEASAPDRRLKMHWALKHWPHGCQPSTVTLTIKDNGHGDGCMLRLVQRGLPAGELTSIRDNWHRYYWQPIKAILGCTGVASAAF